MMQFTANLLRGESRAGEVGWLVRRDGFGGSVGWGGVGGLGLEGDN